tara:strand:+ start:359 stop:589 length:231 start_codon:yes stop_codon:yes gene_type:complete
MSQLLITGIPGNNTGFSGNVNRSLTMGEQPSSQRTTQMPSNKALHLPPGSLCHGPCNVSFILDLARPAPDTWRKLA